DLTRLAEMKRVAAEIADREPPIAILINNAGALFGARRLTEDGLEATFALNHMSYFVVTEGLRERLLASGAARIINTASTAPEGAQTIIYLASSPEVANVTGKYFYKGRPTTPSAPALDDRAALALWERSAALTGMKE